MRKRTFIFVSITMLLLGIVLGRLFPDNIPDDPDTRILFGIPGEDGSINFIKSTPLTNSEDIHNVLYALFYSNTIEKSSAPTTPPDAIVSISANGSNVAHIYSIWLTAKGDIILQSANTTKQISAPYDKILWDIIERYIAIYTT